MSDSAEFLERLVGLRASIETEGMAPDEDDGDQNEEQTCETKEEGTAADLSAMIRPMGQQRRQAFAAIVRFLAERSQTGPVETLPKEDLEPLVRDALKAITTGRPGSMDILPPELAVLLEHHAELGRKLMASEDKVLSAVGERSSSI